MFDQLPRGKGAKSTYFRPNFNDYKALRTTSLTPEQPPQNLQNCENSKRYKVDTSPDAKFPKSTASSEAPIISSTVVSIRCVIFVRFSSQIRRNIDGNAQRI